MTQTRALTFLAAISLFLLTACGTPWRVVRQSGPPSALAGATVIGVAFDWTHATVDRMPEQQHIASRPPPEQADWMEARNQFMSTYMTDLASQLPGIQVVPATGAEPIQLVVQPFSIQRGYWRMIASEPTVIELELVFVVGGQPVDEIFIRATQNASMTNASVVNRMNDCARRLGHITAQFIRRAQSQ